MENNSKWVERVGGRGGRGSLAAEELFFFFFLHNSLVSPFFPLLFLLSCHLLWEELGEHKHAHACVCVCKAEIQPGLGYL